RSSLASPSPGRHRLPGRLALADGRDRGEPGEPAGNQARLVTRCLRTLAGAMVIVWAFRLDGYLTFAPWLAVAVAALGFTGLCAVVVSWLPACAVSDARQHQIGWIAIAAIVAGLALWSYFQVFIVPDYGTDEIAFDQ